MNFTVPIKQQRCPAVFGENYQNTQRRTSTIELLLPLTKSANLLKQQPGSPQFLNFYLFLQDL